MFSVFIDLRRNMFRDCVEVDVSDTVLIDINYDVSMHECNYGNKRLEVDILNCLLPNNGPYALFLFFER